MLALLVEKIQMKCYYCKEEAESGRKLCARHAAKKRQAQQKKRDVWSGMGLCTSCGSKRDLDKAKCSKCYARQIKTSRARTIKRQANNLCVSCGRDKSIILGWTYRNCAGCHLKEKFGFSGTREEAEDIIGNILIKQNYSCPLTGRDLKTNKFHIDHILPKSIRPDLKNNPNNWQIIVADANLFKCDGSIEELLLLCKDIVIKGLKDGTIKTDELTLVPNEKI